MVAKKSPCGTEGETLVVFTLRLDSVGCCCGGCGCCGGCWWWLFANVRPKGVAVGCMWVGCDCVYMWCRLL